MELFTTGCVASARTCNTSSVSHLQDFATPAHAPTPDTASMLLRQSADVKHSVFRSSTVDVCSDSEHLSSILLIQ